MPTHRTWPTCATRSRCWGWATTPRGTRRYCHGCCRSPPFSGRTPWPVCFGRLAGCRSGLRRTCCMRWSRKRCTCWLSMGGSQRRATAADRACAARLTWCASARSCRSSCPTSRGRLRACRSGTRASWRLWRLRFWMWRAKPTCRTSPTCCGRLRRWRSLGSACSQSSAAACRGLRGTGGWVHSRFRTSSGRTPRPATMTSACSTPFLSHVRLRYPALTART
mmetsp:Transcript_7100/g.21669  ORF Transcript_7100/g.21669 Transcript_7100/m.21669 type:complete len:222 (-) Transcript_7100:454-1119(-)